MHPRLPALLSLSFALAIPGALPAQRANGASSLSVSEFARVVLDANLPPLRDRTTLLDRFENALRSWPESPATEELVREWAELAEQPDAPRGAGTRLRALERSELPLHGNARRALRAYLAEHAERRDQHDRVEALDPARDHVRHLLAIGPFGDEGRNFLGVPFVPELGEIDLEATYEGRLGPVAWRPVTRSPGQNSVQLAPRAPSRRSDGAHYGLVQVRSESARAAWLEITCYGPYELWWNGERVAQVDRIRNRPPVRTYYGTPLRKGWNRLLVKTAADRASRVDLRFVDAQSHTQQGLTEEPGRVLHPIARGAVPLPESFEDEADWLARRVAENGKSDGLMHALFAHVLLRQGAPDEALAHSNKAIALGPEDPTIVAAHYEVLRAARHLPSGLQRTEERRLLLAHPKVVASHWHLRWRAIEREVADDQHERALRSIDEILAEHPQCYRALRQKQRILERLDWDGMADAVFDEVVRNFGDAPEVVIEAARRFARRDRPRQALALVQEALNRQPGHRSLLLAAFGHARSAGDLPIARSLRERLDRRDPDGYASLDRQCDLLEDEEDFEAAAKLREKLCELRPQDPRMLEQLGDAQFLAGDNVAALAAWNRALELEPSDHALRRRICHHEGRDPLVETQRYQLDALAEVARYEGRPEDSGAPSTLVLDQMIIRVYPDGSQMEETHQLRRINDRRGVELHEESQRAADADELLEVRTIQPDGTIQKPLFVARRFSMPKLVPGSFVEEHYRNYKPSPGASPIEFVTFFFANADEPFRYSRMVVILPKNHELGGFLLRNFDAEDMSRESLGELEAFIFLKRNMPRMPTEAHMPKIEEVAPWVTFGRRGSTHPYVRRQRNLFLAISQPLHEIREKAKVLVAALGEKSTSDLARARAIHDFVHAHVQSSQSLPGTPPVHTLLEGQGDRFSLQLALLEASGVPWTPALIDVTGTGDTPAAEVPWNAPANYSHLAARVEPRDGAPFWLVRDTPRWFPFGRIPDHGGERFLGGAPYLLLGDDTGIPGRFPSPSFDELGTHFDVTLKLRGMDATLRAEIRILGTEGYGFSEIMRLQDENTRKLIGQNLTGRFYPGWTMRDVSYPGIERTEEPVRVVLELTREGLARERGDEIVLPNIAMPSSLTRRFASRPERNYPFVSEAQDVASVRVRLDLGARRLVRMPRSLLRRKLLLDYALSWSREGRQLVLQQKRILRPGRIPASRFGEWLELCSEVDRVEAEPLRLR